MTKYFQQYRDPGRMWQTICAVPAMRIIIPLLGLILLTCQRPEPQPIKIWRLDNFEASPFCSFPNIPRDLPLFEAIFYSEGDTELALNSSNYFRLQSSTTHTDGAYQIFESDSIVFRVNGEVYPAKIKTHTSDSLVFVFPEGDTFVNLEMVWLRK